MKKLTWILLPPLTVAGLVLAQDSMSTRGAADVELAFFFSESTRDLETAARTLRGLRAKHPTMRVRPIFLAEDFAPIAKPSADFVASIRELRYAVGEDFAVQVYDEDGLALARQLKLDRVPAYAAFGTRGDSRRAAVAYGTRANLEELLRCVE